MTSVPAGPAPVVTYAAVKGVSVPQLVGQPAADATLREAAAGLTGSCQPRPELVTERLASFAWKCSGGQVTTVTVSEPDGRRLSLGDLLTGGYEQYLSSTASAQFSSAGKPGVATADLSTWFLAAGALEVVFPAGVVSYPLATLSGYLRPGGPLARS